MNTTYLRKLRPIGITLFAYMVIIGIKGLHRGLLIQDNKSSVGIPAGHRPDLTSPESHANGTSSTTNEPMVAITPFTFPSDDAMGSMNAQDLMYLFGQFTNSTQIKCNTREVFRKSGDTGKTICLDEYIRPAKSCIVYSFGSDNDFTFEESVIKLFGCKVFTFDPSMGKLEPEAINAPVGCKFTSIGLGASNYVNKEGWTIKTFDETQRQLNHTNEVIDILKVDIEGMEWETFDEMLKAGSFNRVKQLQVEIHFYDNEFHTQCKGNRQQAIDCYWKALRKHQVIVRKKRLGLLKRLNEYGLNVFSSEGNTFYENSQEYTKNGMIVTPLTEVSFINVNYLK